MTAALPFRFQPSQEVPVDEVSGAYPLVLDIDGTLVRSDLLLEGILNLLRKQPLAILMLLVWACRGIAHLKAQVAAHADVAINLLPANEELVAYARAQAAKGRRVYVATAANEVVAHKLCSRFSFISGTLASSDKVNLKGQCKAEALNARFPDGYVYAGDVTTDLKIWRHARLGIFAGRSSRLLRKLSRTTTLEADFSVRSPALRTWVRALRLHQWPKNGLIFLPLLLAGGLTNISGWLACAGIVLAMGLAASATYLINDLVDLDADRQHWTKRYRPLAAGLITIKQGIVASIALLGTGLVLAGAIGGRPIVGLVLLYSTVSLGYSLYLKRVPILDVAILAGLFTFRLVLGAVVVDVRLSPWLMVFSMFLFLSLALAKRSTEVGRTAEANSGRLAKAEMPGRGYIAADAPLLMALGVAAAAAALVIMVLYLILDAFSDELYTSPQLLWAAPILIGLWLSRVWLLCGRGLLNDDPVAFAIRDKVSIALGSGVIGSFAAAALLA